MFQPGKWRGVTKRLAGGMILVFGLWWAAALHRQAASQPPTDVEVVGDVAAALSPEDFKRSARDMEAFGGKGMLRIDQARRWLAGPQGTEILAALIGLCALVAGAALILAADRPEPPSDGDRQP